jgi:hypothetical protein
MGSISLIERDVKMVKKYIIGKLSLPKDAALSLLTAYVSRLNDEHIILRDVQFDIQENPGLIRHMIETEMNFAKETVLVQRVNWANGSCEITIVAAETPEEWKLDLDPQRYPVYQKISFQPLLKHNIEWKLVGMS